MPAPVLVVGLVSLLVGTLRAWAGSIAGAALASLGLYFLIGEPATDYLLGQMQSRFSLVTGTVYETLMYCNVDDFVAMILSAVTVRASMSANVSLRGKRAQAKPLPAP